MPHLQYLPPQQNQPLQLVRGLCGKNGPSLPLGWRLHWKTQLQIFLCIPSFLGCSNHHCNGNVYYDNGGVKGRLLKIWGSFKSVSPQHCLGHFSISTWANVRGYYAGFPYLYSATGSHYQGVFVREMEPYLGQPRKKE